MAVSIERLKAVLGLILLAWLSTNATGQSDPRQELVEDDDYLENVLLKLGEDYQVRIYYRLSDVRNAETKVLRLDRATSLELALNIFTLGSSLTATKVGDNEYIVLPDNRANDAGYMQELAELGRASQGASTREISRTAARPEAQFLVYNEPLYRAFDRIGDRFEVEILYHPDDIPFYESTVREPRSLLEAFNEAVGGTNLRLVKYSGNTFVVAPIARQDKAYGAEVVQGWRSGKFRSPDNAVREILRFKVGEEQETSRPSGSGQAGTLKALVRGTLFDAANDEPLSGAIVYHPASAAGTTTELDGTFALELPEGKQLIELRFLGYTTQPVEVDLRGSGQLPVIRLEAAAAALAEVVVSARDDARTQRDATGGLRRITSRNLKLLPVLSGDVDVLQALTRTAGVAATSEASAGITVRGGGLDANLVRQGGMPVLYPAHALGFFPLFHPDLVSGVNLYRGYVPPHLGGRSASVVDVDWRAGNFERWSGRGSIGLLSGRISAQGPIIKNRLSVIVGARRSYINYILANLRDGDLRRSIVEFEDYSGALTYRWDSGRLNVRGAYANDAFLFSQQFGFDYQNRSLSIGLRQRLGARSSLEVEVLESDFASQLDELASFPGRRTFSSGLRLAQASGRYQLTVSSTISVSGGLEVSRYQTQDRRQKPRENSGAQSFAFSDPDLNALASFGSFTWQPNERWEVDVGARALVAQTTNVQGDRRVYEGVPAQAQIIEQIPGGRDAFQHPVVVQPRLSVSYSPVESTTWGLAYSRLAQAIHQLSPTVSPTPADIFFVSSEYLPVTVADVVSVSHARNVEAGERKINYELGAYYRYERDANAARDGQTLRSTAVPEQGFFVSEGFALGAETSLSIEGVYTTWDLNYTLGRSFLRKNLDYPEFSSLGGGRYFRAPTDIPHQVNASFSYRPTGRFTLGIGWTFTSGRPYSAPSTLLPQAGALIPTLTEINGARLPPTHRLDLSATLDNSRSRRRGLRVGWGLSIYNVYKRRNPFAVYYAPPSDERLRFLRFSVVGEIIPAVNLTFEWD